MLVSQYNHAYISYLTINHSERDLLSSHIYTTATLHASAVVATSTTLYSHYIASFWLHQW